MAEEYTSAGGMQLGELKKQGEKWVGKVRLKIPCSTSGTWSSSNVKICSFEEAIEIVLLTPSRIEGSVVTPPDNAGFKCQSCTYTQPAVKREFVWIPE